MANVRIPYLITKHFPNGRTLRYWQPATRLRQLGWGPRRLSDDLAAAIAEAQTINEALSAWRARESHESVRPQTLPWLIRLYKADERFLKLKESTKVGYETFLRPIEHWSIRAKHPPLRSLQRRHVKAFYRSMLETPAQANAVLRVLRLLLAFAVDEGYLDQNPAERPGLRTLPPRHQVWSSSEIKGFVDAAQTVGRPSLGVAVLLAANLGQRQGDVLRLTWSQFNGREITLRQGKTGVLLAVPVTRELNEALGAIPKLAPTIVISETTGRPYKANHFRHEFRRVAETADLHGLQFLDLRRTAVVRLAEAGCTPPEIAAITGHQLDRTVHILETYLPRTAPMARAAIRKLEAHRKRTESETPSERSLKSLTENDLSR